MDIQTIKPINFKGYDARPLKGFLMCSNGHGIAEEMAKIGKKEGFRIFMPVKNNLIANPDFKKVIFNPDLWAQDYWTILKTKLLGENYNKVFYIIKNALNLYTDFTERISHETDKIKHLQQNLWDLFDEMGDKRDRDISKTAKVFQATNKDLAICNKDAHIAGGNLFIIKNNDKDELIIGKNVLENFDMEDICAMFDVDKVTVLPQMDYHLDLFIRPLNNKKILLADDFISLEVLRTQYEKFNKLIHKATTEEEKTKYETIKKQLQTTIANFFEAINNNQYPQAKEISKILENNGYEVIRVPGRIYSLKKDMFGDCHIQHQCNYINANVLENKKGDLVYITNFSNVDKNIYGENSDFIESTFQESFINYITPYVNRKHIYFVKGEDNFIADKMLPKLQGGIHCTCAEIPKEIKFSKKYD